MKKSGFDKLAISNGSVVRKAFGICTHSYSAPESGKQVECFRCENFIVRDQNTSSKADHTTFNP